MTIGLTKKSPISKYLLDLCVEAPQYLSAGTLIDFFGKKVKTQTGFLKIARKYNLKIIPMKNTRLPDNKLQITFEEPIEHINDKISDEKKMLEINKIVERWIKENPENWFWQHKRFS